MPDSNTTKARESLNVCLVLCFLLMCPYYFVAPTEVCTVVRGSLYMYCIRVNRGGGAVHLADPPGTGGWELGPCDSMSSALKGDSKLSTQLSPSNLAPKSGYEVLSILLVDYFACLCLRQALHWAWYWRLVKGPHLQPYIRSIARCSTASMPPGHSPLPPLSSAWLSSISS